MGAVLADLGAWPNSARLEGDLCEAVGRQAEAQDVVVTGSTAIVHALAAADLVDEHRLLVFPTVAAAGARLFEPGGPAPDLRLTGVDAAGAAALMTYDVAVRN